MSFGDFLFFLGIGLILFGLVWRTRRRQMRAAQNEAEAPITRRQFFTGPFAPIMLGVGIAIWSLYETGNL